MAEKERSRSKTRAAVTLVAVFVLGWGVVVGLQWALNPWSMSLPGRATLTGHWQGEVIYGPDDNRRIVLEQTYSGGRGSNIGGKAKVCGTQNAAYQVFGDTHDYSGSRFTLDPSWLEDKPGLYLNDLEGEWDGDLLRFHGALTLVHPDGSTRSSSTTTAGGTVITSEDPQVRFEMRRSTSDDYDSAC